MALVLKDRVKQTTTTTGTGTLTLSGTVTGFNTFSVIGDGNTTYYAIVNTLAGEWEVGYGTYTAAGTTLTRTTVLESSNGNALVNFSAGSKDVFVTYPAEKAVFLNDYDNVELSGTPTAPTAAVGTNTTQLATTAFVNSEIANDAPTKTGGGASGTWGINITGSSGSTANTLTRGSYLTGNNFNGSAATTWAVDATSANTASKVVARDASGDFSARTITVSSGVSGVDATGDASSVTIDAGNSTSNGVGGDMTITAGNTPSTTAAKNGGDTIISGGNNTSATGGYGASLTLYGGTAVVGLGGQARLSSGASKGTNIDGSPTYIFGGKGTGNGTGGSIYLYTTPPKVSGTSLQDDELRVEVKNTGNVYFRAGIASSSKTTGTITVSGGVGVSGQVTATSFDGTLYGNADTATTLQTARTIALSGGATGTATNFNGSANITIPVTALNATNLSSGTVPDARISGTYSGITLQTNGGNTHYTTPNSGSSSTNDRTVFGLAQYKNDLSNATGAIVFYAPNTNSSIMHRLRIEGMIYAGGPTVMCVVQGYRTTGAWSNTSKINLGITDVQVRLGVDSAGKNCVILGDVGTVWSYPMMAITHAMFSHSGVTDAYCKDWTVGLVTSLTGFTNVTGTLANTAVTTDISGSSSSTTGNAATATTLQTARTINGVSFNGSANITVEPYVEDAGTTSATRYITFVDNSTAGYKRLNEDADLTYNPGTNTLTVPNITAALSGNATTATTLQTARTINGVSFNGSANIVVESYVEDDNSTNATRYLTFVDNSTASYKRLNEDSSLTYNPSTNRLTAGSFAGDGSALTNVSAAQAGGAIYENTQTITSSYTLTSGKNGMSAGPITINSGVTVTVPSGSAWVVV